MKRFEYELKLGQYMIHNPWIYIEWIKNNIITYGHIHYLIEWSWRNKIFRKKCHGHLDFSILVTFMPPNVLTSLKNDFIFKREFQWFYTLKLFINSPCLL